MYQYQYLISYVWSNVMSIVMAENDQWPESNPSNNVKVANQASFSK